MKKTLFICIAFLSSLWAWGQTADLSVERILEYRTDLTVETPNNLIVTETIKVNVLNHDINRGIYRSLPTVRNLNDQRIHLKYDIKGVKRDGKKEKYKTETSGNYLLVYAGNENKILEPGIYEYEISYDVENQIGFFENFDEIYWNATGNEWDFPIDYVKVNLQLPESAEILQNACYTGYANSTEQNCASAMTSANSISFEAAHLRPNEGLTISAAFPKGIITPAETPAILKVPVLSKLLTALLAAIVGFMTYLWNKFGRDHEKPTIYPQFEVPDNLSPASLGYLSAMTQKNEFIAASLINMAVKGYLKISETQKSGFFSKQKFQIEKIKDSDTGLSAEESALFGNLFAKKDLIELDGSYDKNLESAVSAYRKTLDGINHPILKKGNNWPKTLLVFGLISLIYWIFLWSANKALYIPDKMSIGIILYVAALIAIGVQIFLPLFTARFYWIFPVGAALLFIFIYNKFSENDAYSLAYFFLVVSIAFLSVFSYLIRKPSKDLVEIQSHIDGFKMYLETAETELIKFFNPPEITPDVFEKYLPYALILGVSGIWGKKFEQKLNENAYDYNNNWYIGTQSGAFSGAMSNQLSNSLAKSIGTAATPPGGSGSGGGGFSGGGGGGGGGGGW